MTEKHTSGVALKASAADLLTALEPLARLAGRKQVIPVLAYVRLDASGESVTLDGTDLDVRFRASIGAAVTERGVALVPAAPLRALVSLVSGGTPICLRATETTVTVTMNRHCTTFPTCHPAEFPIWPEETPTHTVEMAPAVWSMLARQVQAAIPPQQYGQSPAAAEVRLMGDYLRVSATDGHRVHRATAHAPVAGEVEAALISAPALADAGAFFRDGEDDAPLVYGVSDRDVHVSVGSRQMVIRRVEGRFPNTDRVVPSQFTGTLDADRDALAEAIKRVSLVLDKAAKGDDVRAVEVGCQVGGSVEVRACGRGDSRATETIGADFTGEPQTLKVQSRYLADMLAACESGSVRIELAGGDYPVLVTQRGEVSAFHGVIAQIHK